MLEAARARQLFLPALHENATEYFVGSGVRCDTGGSGIVLVGNRLLMEEQRVSGMECIVVSVLWRDSNIMTSVMFPGLSSAHAGCSDVGLGDPGQDRGVRSCRRRNPGRVGSERHCQARGVQHYPSSARNGNGRVDGKKILLLLFPLIPSLSTERLTVVSVALRR